MRCWGYKEYRKRYRATEVGVRLVARDTTLLRLLFEADVNMNVIGVFKKCRQGHLHSLFGL
jgi:hypothetical protein